MCTNGVNTNQFKMLLEQMVDKFALNRRWVHKLAHQAGDNGYEKTDETLHQIQALLDEARALMTDAKDALDDDAENLSGVTVNLV